MMLEAFPVTKFETDLESSPFKGVKELVLGPPMQNAAVCIYVGRDHNRVRAHKGTLGRISVGIVSRYFPAIVRVYAM